MPIQNIVILPSTTPEPVIGTLILNFNEFIDSLGTDTVLISINGNIVRRQTTDINGLDSWRLYVGDVVQLSITSNPSTYRKVWSISRRDYTTDDIFGDNGIRDTFITSGVTGAFPAIVNFTVDKDALAYNFEYLVTISTDNLPTPTPTPSPTPTSTPTPTATPVGPTPTPTPTATPTITPTPSPTPIDGLIDPTYNQSSNGWVWDINIFSGNTVGTTYDYPTLGSGVLYDNNGTYIAAIPNSSIGAYRPTTNFCATVEQISSTTYAVGDGWDTWSQYNPSGPDFTVTTRKTALIDSGFVLISEWKNFSTASGYGSVYKIRNTNSLSGQLVAGDGYLALVSGATITKRSSNGDGVFDFVEDSSNSIFAVGSFASAGNYKLTKFDSALSSVVASYGTFDGQVLGLAIQSDNKIIAVGSFNNYSGISCNKICRINTDGTLDTSFVVTTGFEAPAFVLPVPRAVAIQPCSGKIVVGGIFSSYNGSSSKGLVRINTNGSFDFTFGVGSGFSGGYDNIGVWRLAIQSDDKILVGGNFTSYNGTACGTLIRLTSPTSICPTPTPTPIPGSIPTGSLFYYDPGDISSYPGSGSVLYDLSGNGRNANINAGINWVSGSAAYFDLNGADNNSITGTTLSQTLTSWSMWIGIYRDTQGDYDGFITERTGGSDINGLGAFSTTNRLDLNVNNNLEITEPTGRMTTGAWMFLGGAVDNTTYTSMVYRTGGFDTFISGSKVAGSSNFNNAIVLGEDKETGTDRTMDGRIGPVLMYDRKLSTSELITINNYFKGRYGII